MSIEDFVRAGHANEAAARGLKPAPLAEVAFNLAWILAPATVLALTGWPFWRAAHAPTTNPVGAWPTFSFAATTLLGFCFIAGSTGSWRPSNFELTPAAETAAIFRAMVAVVMVLLSGFSLFQMLSFGGSR
ncbi:MAG: hypothetical protein L0G87_03620 [Renibacterium salmoninarum]|nr:hypothetical protein [Renibacterium salmoninarum]